MDEVKVDITLKNVADRLSRSGRCRAQSKRSRTRGLCVRAGVDTGAVMLSLPQDVVEKLDLEEQRRAIVCYADDRREERPIAGPVWLKIGDRSMITECVVMPPASEPLLGQIPLEAMDLIVGPQRKTLGPRPESPIYPMLNLK